MIRALLVSVLAVGSLLACDSDFTTPDVVLVDLGIDPVASENMNTSYHKSKPAKPSAPTVILPAIDYSALPGFNAALLHDAVAYLDVDDDDDIDVLFATGMAASATAYDAELYINAGDDATFSEQISAFFVDNTPPVPTSLEASKSLVSDFTGDGLDDVFVLDQAIDATTLVDEPKFYIHQTELSDPNDINSALIHSFRYQIFAQDSGSHSSGAAADIDNDGDADIFVAGPEPFFYINNSLGGFSRVNNRWDRSMGKVLAAELVDVDLDGYVDLVAGANEADGDVTSIYWGNSSGTYTSNSRTSLPAYAGYGVILDFEVENLDGDSNRDLVIYRTSSSDTDRVVQIIKNNGGRSFADITATSIVNPVNTLSPWLRAQDHDNDGDIDIFPDNAAAGYWFQNNGSAVFTRI